MTGQRYRTQGFTQITQVSEMDVLASLGMADDYDRHTDHDSRWDESWDHNVYK